MAEKKKKTPKTPFEKIGAAYESEARRQEKSGNTEMALRTRQAAAKSMTKDNQKAFEEDTQAAKERKMASKKTKSKDKGADAVEVAGAKAKDAVGKAQERNPIGKTKASSKTKKSKSEKKDKEPARPSFGSVSEQREKNPPPKSEYPNFGSVKEQREKNPPPGNAGYSFGSVAEQRAKAGPVEPSKLRAGAEGTSGKSKGTRVGANDTTTEMPATTKDKDAERADRIKELATSGVSKDPNDKGEMPDDPKPRSKPTVLITPNDKGEMPDPNKPGFMDRMGGRMKSLTSRPGARAAPSSGSGGGAGPSGPSGPKGPAVSQTQETKDGTKQTQSAPATSSGITFAPQAGGNVVQNSQYTEKGDNNKDVTQTITGNGQPITATTSGKATSSGGRGITASTSGTATSHPRAQNASRGGRPTSKKK